MRLFVGLGNPGAKYAGHRHNIGFMAVDQLVRRHNFGPERQKFQALVHDGRLGTDKILALKPQTYMNESGRAVGEAMRFYKLTPDDVFVFYDELDLAFGKLKVKRGGGAAGHNGIRSISAHIGPDFHRVRLGIGHPGDRAKVTGYVLGDFAKSEQTHLDPWLDALALKAEWLAKGDSPRYMTEVAKQLAPARAEKPPAPPPIHKTDTAAPAQKGSEQKTKKEGPMADMLRALKGDN